MAEVNLKNYVDINDRFSVSVPDDWSVQQGDFNSPVTFRKIISKGKSYLELRLEISDVPQENLDKFCNNVKSNIKLIKSYTSLKLTSEEMLVLDGTPAKKIIFDHKSWGDPNKERDILFVFIEGGVGWIIWVEFWNVDFNLYSTAIDSIISSFHLHDTSRGENATTNILKPVAAIREKKSEVRRSEIRGWAIGLIILGIVSIFVPALNTVWGYILIGAGIIEMIYPRREMFAVNGVLLIIAGFWNAVPSLANGEYLWGMLGVAQFGWGVQQFTKLR